MWLLNQYRAAEVHGAGAVMRMGRLSDSTQLSTDLSRHLRDEAVHAWLWTRAIEELGGTIAHVNEPYQTRLSFHFGIPRTLNDMLALTLVSEKRGLAQYRQHLDESNLLPPIQRTLRGIIKDEEWHVSYIQDELQRRARSDRAVQELIDRAAQADLVAMAELSKGTG
jgi:1,2-phenylacetyl-CoA epoxidase catalytic subunit